MVGAADLAVTQNSTPNMSVNVAAGMIWMPGTLGATGGMQPNLTAQTAYGLPSSLTAQGSYCAYQDGTVNLGGIGVGDPTNPRIDIVVAALQDAQYSGSNNQPVLQYLQGTPAPSPSAPAAPASAVVLAQVAVAANQTTIVTANITDVRPFFCLAPRFVPAMRIYATSVTTIASGSVNETQVVNMTTDWSYGATSLSSNSIVIPRAGVYVVSGFMNWQAVGGGSTNLAGGMYYTNIRRNTTNVRGFNSYVPAATSTALETGGSDLILLAANDTLSLRGVQYSGSSQQAGGWLSASLIAATN